MKRGRASRGRRRGSTARTADARKARPPLLLGVLAAWRSLVRFSSDARALLEIGRVARPHFAVRERVAADAGDLRERRPDGVRVVERVVEVVVDAQLARADGELVEVLG